MKNKETLSVGRTSNEGQKIWVQNFSVDSHPKNVVLVQTIFDLTFPNGTTTKFVKVATLSHQHIARL
jgi:hypothetical protein